MRRTLGWRLGDARAERARRHHDCRQQQAITMPYGARMTGAANSTGGGNGPDARLAQMITTIFALYARAEGNWLSIASVVAMMADLGCDSQAVRSAISRLKRRGVLLSEHQSDSAGYSLSAETLEALAEGDTRIFERTRATMDDGWVVVIFSVPESEREKRHSLRSNLIRLGFGTAAPGVWLAPGNLADDTRQALDRRGLAEYVDIFSGPYLAFGDLRAKVRTWWDLDELSGLYADFLQRYRSALYRASAEGITPEEAFQIYVPMLTQWRRLPYRDPGLPLSLLPPAWNGEAAGELFDDLNQALSPLAQKHALAIVHGRRSKLGEAKSAHGADRGRNTKLR
jgi:phenylacetic acid degradation operon negative regulatory protein